MSLLSSVSELNSGNVDDNTIIYADKASADYKVKMSSVSTYIQSELVTASITVASLDITGITNGYVPYVGASALAASPIYVTGARVGVGTASPDANPSLHVVGTAYPAQLCERTTALTAQTVASFCMRATSSGNMADDFGPTMAFEIEDDAATSNIVGLVSCVRAGADNTGRIMLEPYSAGSKVSGALIVKTTGVAIMNATLEANYSLELPNSSSQKAKAYAWDTYSDGRFKFNQEPIDYGLSQVLEMVPKRYDYLRQFSDIGLVAQELYDVVPEAVNRPTDDQSETWAINYPKLIPILIKAIQELHDEIIQLKGE